MPKPIKTVNSPEQKFIAHSIDYDNCLSCPRAIHQQSRQTSFAVENKGLLDYIRAKANGQPTVLLVGSNRQSYDLDQHNARQNKNGSCFAKYGELVRDFARRQQDVRLERLLMADVYNDLPNGTSFNRAVDHPRDKQMHVNTVFDEDKISLLYAQVHSLASTYPGQPIRLYFYDDSQRILENLAKHYQSNPSCLPSNVSLVLRQYKQSNGVVLWYEEFKADINGCGSVDNNFRETLKYCAFNCEGIKKEHMNDSERSTSICDFSNYLKDKLINGIRRDAMKPQAPQQRLSQSPRRVAVHIPSQPAPQAKAKQSCFARFFGRGRAAAREVNVSETLSL